MKPYTPIVYGLIAASSLKPELVQALLTQHGINHLYEMLLKNHLANRQLKLGSQFDEAYEIEEFRDNYVNSELEVFRDYLEVKYQIRWINGVLHFYILRSPNVVRTSKYSGSIFATGNLDVPNPQEVECYDVPADWKTVP